MIKTLISNNNIDTISIGERLGNLLLPNDIVLLNGDLGVGKSELTRGIAKALGINAPITSPTFTIVNEYEGTSLKLYHFDLYRIEEESELFFIGFDEIINSEGVCVIEWADKFENLLPNTPHLSIEIEYKDINKRSFTIYNKNGFRNINI